MRLKAAFVVSIVLSLAVGVSGQLGVPFSGQFEPVTDGSEGTSPATGTGFVYSVMDYYEQGPKIMVNGTFDALNSPATVAHVHRATLGPDDPNGPTPGPKVFDLTISQSTNGTVNGSFWITEEQAEEIANGWYYIQIHSEANPAGALRSWLVRGFADAEFMEDEP